MSNNPSVEPINTLLTHIVTQYDMGEARKKHYNVYALSQYLMGVENVVAMISNGHTLEAAISKNFQDRLLSYIEKRLVKKGLIRKGG